VIGDWVDMFAVCPRVDDRRQLVALRQTSVKRLLGYIAQAGTTDRRRSHARRRLGSRSRRAASSSTSPAFTSTRRLLRDRAITALATTIDASAACGGAHR
jgi:hypothetical protein